MFTPAALYLQHSGNVTSENGCSRPALAGDRQPQRISP